MYGSSKNSVMCKMCDMGNSSQNMSRVYSFVDLVLLLRADGQWIACTIGGRKQTERATIIVCDFQVFSGDDPHGGNATCSGESSATDPLHKPLICQANQNKPHDLTGWQ